MTVHSNGQGKNLLKTMIYGSIIIIALTSAYLVWNNLSEKRQTVVNEFDAVILDKENDIGAEILTNIYNELKSNNLIDSDFNTWQNNFNESNEVRANVYNYLLKNNLTDSDYEQWERNIYNGTTTSNNIYTNNSSALYQENDESTDPTDIADMSCIEILATIVDNGDLISDLNDSDMNSSALDFIALYEYKGLYYLVVEFTSSSKKYVYCDINYSDWNNFIDNAGDSYGESFNDHLGYSSCNCD